MSQELVDVVSADMWTVDDSDHDIQHDENDDDIADDVFEASSMMLQDQDDGTECDYQRPPPPPVPQRNTVVLSGTSGKRLGENDQVCQGSAHRHTGYDSWSVSSHRYADTTSIITRLHPTFSVPEPHPPTLVLTNLLSSSTPRTEDPGGMITLHSLGCGRDSGYVPSPSSANSFTFSSDEDEPKAAATVPQLGVTPPIAIPHARHRPTHHLAVKEQRHKEEMKPPVLTKEEIEPNTQKEDWKPINRRRVRSCPEQMRASVLPRAPVPRFPITLTPNPSHGRNWSTPATTPDGQPILTPTSSSEARGNISRDGIIDLTEGDGRVNGGHRRRVLVLALPDLVMDTEGRASGACTPPSSIPSAQSSFGDLNSINSFSGVGGRYGVRPRPAWHKPRALSCDVTMEVEVGQELRRIADTFGSQVADGEQVSVWRRLRNSLRR
ncbi:uncharacterized protein [Cherax quadricarinatus]